MGEAEVIWSCDNCGATNSSWNHDCSRCGNPRGYSPLPGVPEGSYVTPHANSRPCSFCGTVPRLVVHTDDESACICIDCALHIVKLIANAASDMLKQMPMPVPIQPPTDDTPRIILP